MAADYNGVQGLDVQLSWPEDTGDEGAAPVPAPSRAPGVAVGSESLARLAARLDELVRRIAMLEEAMVERLDGLDDRLEYLAGAGMLPAPTGGGGEEPGSGLVQVSDQLADLTKEVTALRRRITLRARGEPGADQASTEKLADAVADLVVARMAAKTKPKVSAPAGSSPPEATDGRRRRR